MRRTRVLVVVGSLTAAVVVGSLSADPARVALDSWRAERAWPQDQALVTASMDTVHLPDDYTHVMCPDDVEAATRCWRTRLTPEHALPDLRAAAGSALGVGSLETVPLSSPETPRGPSAAHVTATLTGTYHPQGFTLIALRDHDEHATGAIDMWLDTTTVWLVPTLSTPSGS